MGATRVVREDRCLKVTSRLEKLFTMEVCGFDRLKSETLPLFNPRNFSDCKFSGAFSSVGSMESCSRSKWWVNKISNNNNNNNNSSNIGGFCQAQFSNESVCP